MLPFQERELKKGMGGKYHILGLRRLDGKEAKTAVPFHDRLGKGHLSSVAVLKKNPSGRYFYVACKASYLRGIARRGGEAGQS